MQLRRAIMGLIIALTLAIAPFPLFPSQENPCRLLKVELKSWGKATRLTLSLSEPPRYDLIPTGKALTIKLYNCSIERGAVPGRLSDGVVRSIGVGKEGRDLLIAVKLRRRANLTAFSTKAPPKLVIDLYPVPERPTGQSQAKPSARPQPESQNGKPERGRIERPAPTPASTEMKAEPETARETRSGAAPEGKRSEAQAARETPAPPPVKPLAKASAHQAGIDEKPAHLARTGPSAIGAGSAPFDRAGSGSGRGEKPADVRIISPFALFQIAFDLLMVAALYAVWRYAARTRRTEAKSAERPGEKFEEMVVELSEEDPKVRQVKRMLAKGMSIDEIAKNTGIPKGEIELISNLSNL